MLCRRLDALRDAHHRDQKTWNHIPDNIRQLVVGHSLDYPEFTPRELTIPLCT